MKILRTMIWVLALVAFLIFSIYNWKPVEVTLWQNLVMETRLPVLALMAFMLGFLPLWAYHLSVKWGLNRRVKALENSLKTAALARHHEPHAPAPVHTSGEKPVTKGGESADPLAPADNATDGGAGE
ncbi:MAG: DUF1049 domain-containing protein [Erythrobacter sp.]|nr:DUF1049 domain-containing protein [Erythrobacter sp.]